MPIKLTMFRKGVILVAVPLLFQLALIGLVEVMREQTVEADRASDHTKEVLAQSETVLARLVDLETGNRGYVFTGNAVFTEPYDRALVEVPAAIEKLKTLVSDNSSQQAKVEEMAGNIARLIEWTTARNQEVRTGDRDKAIAKITALEGKNQMDALRRDMAAFRLEEDRLYAEQGLRRDRSRQGLQGMLILGAVVAVGITLLLALVFSRGISNRMAVLADNARRLGQGQELAGPIGGADEISAIDQAFRDMAQNLARGDKARQAAEAETQKNLRLLDQTRDGLFIFDSETLRFSYVNDGAIAQVGYTRQELLRMTPLDIKPEYDEATFRNMVAPLSDGQVQQHTFTTVHRRKDGVDVPVESILQCAALNGGSKSFVALVRDITERKRTEETIRLYADIVKNVPIGLLIYRLDHLGDDHSLRLVDGNPSASGLLGIDVQSLLGQPALQAFPALKPEMLKAFADVVRTGTATAIEDVHYGDERVQPNYWEVKAFPLPDCRVGVAFENISERKQAEDAIRRLNEELEQRVEERTAELRQSEERFKTIFDQAPMGIAVIDSFTGVIYAVNSSFARIAGRTVEEMANIDWMQITHPDDVQEDLDNMALLNAGKIDGFQMEKRYLLPDGAPVWISMTIAPLKIQGQKTSRHLCMIEDITQRKVAEERLQRQLARLHLINQITQSIGERQDMQSIYRVVLAQLEENLPVDLNAICSFDPHTKSLQVAAVGPKSQPLNAQLGLDERAVFPVDTNALGACVRGETVYDPDLTEVDAPIPQKLARAGLRSLAAAPLGMAGKTIGVLLTARREANGYSSTDCEFLKQLSNHVFLAAQHAQLYQDLKNAYDDLQQSQKAMLQQERLLALGQMASGIAHDINNTISPIAIYAEALLEKEANLSPRARDYLTTIAQAIDDVAHTVARMRDFYRQQEKQVELQPVDLNALVPQVVDLTRARWRDQSQQRGVTIALQTELAPDLPAVMGVESEIRDALINLLLNGVDAMPQGGALTIRTREGGRRRGTEASDQEPATHAILEVQDTGVGMDEETRQRCLEPFFTTKGERGTGLGLAMVYGTMQRHSGDIEIVSTPGQGTTIRLLFLLPQGLVKGSDSVHDLPKPIAPRRILVVDDDALLRKSLQDALQDDGHRVTVAVGGQEGVEAFRAAQARGEPFEIVITDLGMPNMDGRAVAQAIKQSSPTTAVILLTGWGQRMKTEGDIPAHVDRVLSKPPKLKELRAALASLTEERKMPNDKP